MNKKVYLSNLEWAQTHDNMCGVMGNLVFKDNMSYENYQKLTEGFFILCDKDYITNLQQELKEANESVEWWANRFKAMQKENENFRKLKESYQLKKEFYESRIDKAIEYIEKEYQDNIIITDYADNPITPQELYGELLDILKGDSNE